MWLLCWRTENTMDFQFVIPQDSGELLNSDGNNYFVKRVHNARDLKDLLNGKHKPKNPKLYP